MSKKIYTSPEITVTKIQLQSMLMDLSNGNVTFGDGDGDVENDAASRRGGHSLWDDEDE